MIIKIDTFINAPKERCFKLSTSIDLHKISADQTKEEAIAGRTSGLIQLHETVTWRAKHFGIWFKMKVKIVDFENPNYFVDEMIKGPFKYMRHRHDFESKDNGTLMKCTFEFASPFGPIGSIVDKLIMRKHMTNFLEKRNQTIKTFAESDQWKEVL